jgi:D-galactarolactone cycloisomerase
LCEHISGIHPHDVDAYGSSIYYYDFDRDPAVQASAWADRGYTAIKVKVGRISLAEDLRRLQAVRAAVGPQMRLMADANQSCDAMSAIALAKALQEFDVFWLEEPVAARDFEAHGQVKEETLMPIAAGESLHTLEDFQLVIIGNLLDVVQLNVGRVGGIDRAIEIFRWARTGRVAIHHWGTPIGLAASLHLACCLPPEWGVLMEVDLSPNPLRSAFCWPENARPHGRIAPPAGPGLGLDLDEATLSRFMRREETLVSKR